MGLAGLGAAYGLEAHVYDDLARVGRRHRVVAHLAQPLGREAGTWA